MDLNVDVAEGFPFDKELLEWATSANVCCGEHAGDWELSRETILYCLEKKKRFGMHPGFPDRETMGRGPVPAARREAYVRSLREQAERFVKFERPAYVKPHGTWYNMICAPDSEGLASLPFRTALVTGIVATLHVPPMLLAGSRLTQALREGETKPISEGFADRRYAPDGQLVSRTDPDALLEDTAEIRDQVLRLAPSVDSLCVHGDTPNCVAIAEIVVTTLTEAGYEVGN